MMRYSHLVILSFAAAPLAAQQGGGAMPMMNRPPEIVTSAQGEARVTPDRATVFIGVETRAATAAQAGAQNARKQAAVIDTLRALGIAKEQISTVGYNVYPQQSFPQPGGDQTPKIVGYNVSNTVRVEVGKLDQLGKLLDAALAKGANAINSLELYASNQDDARRAAYAEAVARARADAEALARAAHGHLGDLLELSTTPTVQPPRPYPFAAMAMKSTAETPISAGEQTITVNVMARWSFVADAK
ncbi:MAG: SIMPL domain-containing protein [Gemmatimonadaceae bacterium]|nr:SIMPL domain-containing protein [Gemmatimonadaceae bacterium]